MPVMNNDCWLILKNFVSCETDSNRQFISGSAIENYDERSCWPGLSGGAAGLMGGAAQFRNMPRTRRCVDTGLGPPHCMCIAYTPRHTAVLSSYREYFSGPSFGKLTVIISTG